MRSMLKRLRIQAEDRLRYCPAVRGALAAAILAKARRTPAANPDEAVRRVHRLCQAARLAPAESTMLRTEAAIERLLPAIDPEAVPWAEFLPGFDGAAIVQKAIVLKRRVSEREKGVVFFSFDSQMARLARAENLQEFARRYTLVLAPSWSPPHSIVSYLFPRLYRDTIFCLLSNPKDRHLFPRIHEQYVPVPLYASNWVDARLDPHAGEQAKEIDILMVANFGKFKRHFVLFSALRDLPRTYKVQLVGQDEPGRTRESILREAALYGVADRFSLRQDVPYDELQRMMTRARISLVLSRREGSCVVVAESIFANTPVGLFADAEIGSRVFLNEQTGRLLRHGNLAAQIREFVASSAQFQPRKWAVENGIDCVSSSRTLNSILKQHALARGEQWTEDIATLCWRPDPQYYDPQDGVRLLPSCAEIEAASGIRIAIPR